MTKRLVIEAQDQPKPFLGLQARPTITACTSWVVYHNVGPTLDLGDEVYDGGGIFDEAPPAEGSCRPRPRRRSPGSGLEWPLEADDDRPRSWQNDECVLVTAPDGSVSFYDAGAAWGQIWLSSIRLVEIGTIRLDGRVFKVVDPLSTNHSTGFWHLRGEYELERPNDPRERLELIQMIAMQTWPDAHIELIGGVGAIDAVMQAVVDYRKPIPRDKASGDDEG